MKKTLCLTLTLLGALTSICMAADAAKPAAAKPAAAKPAAKPAAAAKPAKKPIDPKVLAERARYSGVPHSRFAAMRMLDEEYPKCIEAWIELRDMKIEGAQLDSIWGYRARRDAEKRKMSLASDMAKLQREFTKEFEKADKYVNRDFSKIRKEADKMAERPKSASEKLNAMQAAELQKARDKMELYEDMVFALEEMQKALGNTDSGKTSEDRLTQIGATHGHGQGLSKDQQRQYETIIETTYQVKDYFTDIVTFEARKAEGKDWRSTDERTLTALRTRLLQTGAKLEQYVARERLKLKREMDDLKRDVEQLDQRLERMSEGKSFDRYQQEKWDTEAEVIVLENTDKILAHFAEWKPKPPEKKGAKPTADKKKAGH